MENDGQLNNNNEQQALDLTLGDNTAWDDYTVEYDMDALLGVDQNVETDQRTDEEDHLPESETPRSKCPKRFKVQQVNELEAIFQECTHPDVEQRQQIGARIGLEERQVRFWFQNRRSSAKVKACGNEVKELLQENEKLKADNNELKQLMLDPTCLKCRDPAAANRAASERQLLLSENARLKHELQRAYMNRSIRQAELPQSMSASAYMNPAVPFTHNRTNNPATLRFLAERALREFVMLATKGQPLWMPTVHGEVLSHQHYDLQTFPAGLLGMCPWGFVMEATRETDMIKGDAEDFVRILTDVAQWSEMFPDIVSYVRSSNVICSGSSSLRDGLIQLMDVEFWVQTPCLPNRNVKFLRFSKMVAERKWAVVDVSVDGFQQQSSGASCTGYRLLPSGCILEGMSGGFCKVTWVVHGEYLEAAVPTLFRKFLHSGQAFGACRWLKSFQRQCEYMAVLASCNHIASSNSSSSGAAAISSLGKRGVLELAQRMTASFYAAISGPVTIASTNLNNQWSVSTSSGITPAEKVDAPVRMVMWNCAEIVPGEPAVTVLSATTTVRLPGVPPVHVFEYLCNLQRRGEWDTNLVSGGAVKELGYVSTSARLHGNAVSVLRPTIVAQGQGSHGMNSNMLILQQSRTDASGSLVVYSLIEENVTRGIMAGGAENNIFLVPSGFAIFPDGHGKSRYNAAPCSSSSSAHIDNDDDNDAEGALLTVAFQTMLPSSPSGDDHATTRAFDDAGQQLCDAIKKIRDAVGASNVIVN